VAGEIEECHVAFRRLLEYLGRNHLLKIFGGPWAGSVGMGNEALDECHRLFYSKSRLTRLAEMGFPGIHTTGKNWWRSLAT
jgi:hypothetical protein